MTADSTLHRQTLQLPLAPLGADNPLPLPDGLLEAPFSLDDDLPAELQAGARIEQPRSMHPYLLQDGYGRGRQPTEVEAVVLDNGILRATFLPWLGGRLWSLVDLATGEDLVYANACVQPANLALRNAWVAGGVEWNIGTKGHSAHTMAPLHAAVVDGPDGAPRLRMWELDRVRRVVFQIDAWLPAGARGLHVYVRIENPNEADVPMYWWSNAAVRQHADLRVLAPARRAYATGYDGTVAEVSVPSASAGDHTWPAASPRSADYFYAIEETGQPWVAGVDSTGHGLAIVSTSRLHGRKLFCWGSGEGGRHWQRWLSPDGGEYLELQAGLTATQFEHVLMPACTSWDWLEVYGDVTADARVAHGEDWDTAVAHVAGRVAELAAPEYLDTTLASARALADQAPAQGLAAGSGWGALERELRRATGEPWIDETSRPFSAATLAAEQDPWHRLLTESGTDPFTGADPAAAPLSYVTGGLWENRLHRLAPSWLRDYHLGVLAHARADLDTARDYLRSSHTHRPNAWARRGEARVLTEQGETSAALELLTEALQLAPEEPGLLLEAMSAALAAGRPGLALTCFDSAPQASRSSGRARLLEGTAALRTGARDRAEAVLASDLMIPDLREGERSLSDLWRETFGDRPIPAHYDFRMN
ncbi:DUF5107 domain-containing protein [Ruania zhangjianzhongii]|uniref:DUF5107 domain-containing protein n=1 Tax=Ruania zhangjianzhongii TaxID=2603206 RepID=UPI0011C8DB48|nr:DUF5107 domain-containing protein [Ruania zhangjianzhongii]